MYTSLYDQRNLLDSLFYRWNKELIRMRKTPPLSPKVLESLLHSRTEFGLPSEGIFAYRWRCWKAGLAFATGRGGNEGEDMRSKYTLARCFYGLKSVQHLRWAFLRKHFFPTRKATFQCVNAPEFGVLVPLAKKGVIVQVPITKQV